MMYCRFFPLTLMDLVPDFIVGALPQPAEAARLVRIFAVLTSALWDSEESIARSYEYDLIATNGR